MKVSYKSTGRLGSHFLFWTVAIGLLTWFYGHFTEQYQSTFWFVCLQMPVVIATVYFINYRLVERFLLPGKWLKFGLYFFYTLVISVYLQLSVVVYSYMTLADYRYERMNPISSDIVFLVFGTYFLVFLATSVKMLKHWLEGRNKLERLEKERLEAELKLRETELKVLRGQIQPHFLFNTLNNLYGMALEKADQLPQSILQLSNILDFLLYRSDKDFIALKEELGLLENYIELEHLRFEKRLQFEKSVMGSIDQVQIPPFAIFTLIENAFKHGFSEDSGPLRLQLKVRSEGNELAIEVQNSIPSKAENKTGGLGLPNLRKRLEHAYEYFTLKTEKEPAFFTATLKIDLTSQKHETA